MKDENYFTEIFQSKNLKPREKLIILLSKIKLNNEKYLLIDENQNFDQLTTFLKKLNDNNLINFIYNNKPFVHQILYDSEEILQIDDYDLKPSFYNLFYLSLLIGENSEIVNYKYNFFFVNSINEINLINLKPINKLFLAKIIIEIIKNYEECDEYDEEDKLSHIIEENNKFIDENINNLININPNINTNFILNNKIDEIYAEIIDGLFKNKKLDDYEYSSNLLSQLELEKLNLTDTIKSKLYEIFNEKEEYINEYQIKDKNSLLNVKIINFYNILFKYLLKDSIYIYSIPFLIKARKKVIKIIKSNENLSDEVNEKIKEKFNFVINFFADSIFYTNNNNRIPKEDLLQLNEILKYYKECKFESKAKEIMIIEDIIKNNKKEYQEYLNDYEEAIYINSRIHIIKQFYKLENVKSEDKINANIKNWKIIEKLIKDKKTKKMRKGPKEFLLNYFNDINNRENLYKIFEKEIIDSFIKENKTNIHKNKGQENNIILEEDIQNEDKAPTPISPENFVVFSVPIGENKKIDKPNSKKEDSTKIKSNKENSDILSRKIPKNKFYKFDEDLENFISMKEKNIDINIVTNMLKNSSILIEYEKKTFHYKDISYGEHNIKITDDIFKTNLRNYHKRYKSENILYENCKYFSFFLDDFENRISNEFLLNYKLKINLKLKENQSEKNENGLYNITCIYTFYEPISNSEIRFKEDNILINGTNSSLNGLDYLLLEINNEYYNNIKIYTTKANNNSKNKKSKNNSSKNKNSESNSKKQTFYSAIDLSRNTDEFKIIDFIKIAEEKHDYNGFIKQLRNGHYVICKTDNSLNIYDIYFNHLKEIKSFDSLIFNICERINNEEKGENISEIITCSKTGISLITINFENYSHSMKTQNLSEFICLNCIEMKPTNHVILSQKGILHITDLLAENRQKLNQINELAYFGCARINDNIIVITSNSVIPNGKDILSFFNIRSKRVSNSIEGYSFVLSSNGLAIIQRENINKNEKKIDRILILCSCKKYSERQRNGILLVNGDLSNNKSITNPFYDTDDIEINCICPLDIIDNNNRNFKEINEKYRKNIKITETDYFLVGGFDTAKRQGVIKLYKVFFNGKISDTEIKFIQDIYIEENEKFKGFEQPVDSIIQSKISGNIIVGCYNEKIYMFTPPNLNYYLRN